MFNDSIISDLEVNQIFYRANLSRCREVQKKDTWSFETLEEISIKNAGRGEKIAKNC